MYCAVRYSTVLYCTTSHVPAELQVRKSQRSSLRTSFGDAANSAKPPRVRRKVKRRSNKPLSL